MSLNKLLGIIAVIGIGSVLFSAYSQYKKERNIKVNLTE